MNGLPIAREVDVSAAKRPERTRLEGQFVSILPLDAASHGQALWESTQGEQNHGLWVYLFSGPFADRVEFETHLIARRGGRRFVIVRDSG